MTWLGDLPVQRKLGFAMLLTSTVVVASACLVFLTVEYYGYRNSLFRTVATLGRITADNSTAAVAFADKNSAGQNLEALRAETQIVAAVLYDNEGQIFAQFVTNPEEIIKFRPVTLIANLVFQYINCGTSSVSLKLQTLMFMGYTCIQGAK